MSNQVYANSVSRYDLANTASGSYVKTAVQSIPDVATTRVVGWSSSVDKGLSAVVSIVSDEFVFDKAGVYHIQFNWLFNANATGSRKGSILLTPAVGSAQRLGNVEIVNGGVGARVEAQSVLVWKMEAGDKISLEVAQNSGAPLDLFGDATDPRTNVVITRVA